MSDTRYDDERLEGASLIIKEAERLAAEAGLTIHKPEWDGGEPIARKTNHLLSITANGKTITGKFPDEWLADYPGRVGTERANAVLSEMIRSLK